MQKRKKTSFVALFCAVLLAITGCKDETLPQGSEESTLDTNQGTDFGGTEGESASDEILTGVTSIRLMQREDFSANTNLEDVNAKYYIEDTAEAISIVIQDQTVSIGETTWTLGSESISCDGVTLKTETDEISDCEIAGYMTVTIKKGGVYRISGRSDLCSLRVDAGDEQVWLMLDGVSFSVPLGPVIYVLQADKTVIHLVGEQENILEDVKQLIASETVDEIQSTEETDAVIFAKDDLIINGTGTLQVIGKVDKGIHTKDDLRLRGGILRVTSAGDGIQGNDSVELSAGHYEITAGADGLVSKTPDEADTDKGYITISGGILKITAQQDGIVAGTDLTIKDGETIIQVGGGASNGENHNDGMGGGFFWGNNSTTTSNTVSKKGIKVENKLLVQGGVVEIDAADDALHSNDQIYIAGGFMQLSSGDDGIHGENELVLTGNSCVNVTQSYEGLEGAKITIAGGCHHIIASDDGLNAAGGTETNGSTSQDNPPDNGFWGGGGWGGPGGGMGFGSGNQVLDITGGYLYVNAGGDGLDSNGTLNISGGIIVVAGPTNDGNGPLDCGEGYSVSTTGGILIAVGSTGMMETPEQNCVISTKLNASKGTLVTVTDENNQVLISMQVPKQAAGIVASANGLAKGYRIYTGGTCSGSYNADGVAVDGILSNGTEIEQTTGGGFGGPGGFGGGGFGGGRPGGR